MADFPSSPFATVALFGPLPGSTTGTIGTTPPGMVAVAAPAAFGSVAAGPTGLPSLPAEPTVIGNAKIGPWLNVAGPWFDQLHVLPREPLDFGRVAVETDLPYEVHSAFGVPIAFTGAALPAGSVTLPGLPAVGTIVAPFGSLLDAASTAGTPVRLEARAALAGAYSFAGDVAFSFVPGGTALLGVEGLRFQVLCLDYETPLHETLEWLTSVLQVSHGPEQRVAVREYPRQRFRVRFLVDGDTRRRLQAQLFAVQGRAFALPLWLDRVELTAASAPGATTLQVTPTAAVDLRVGGFAIVAHGTTSFDVVRVAGVGANTITLDAAMTPSAGYAPRDVVAPLRLCLVDQDVSGVRYPVAVEDLEVALLCVENVTGAPTGDLTPYATVYGHPFLDDPNALFSARMDERFRTRAVRVDPGTGDIWQAQEWPTNRRHSSRGMTASTRAQAWAHRRALYGLRGRQVSFWTGTAAEDLRVVADLVSAATTMDVAHLGYTELIRSRGNKATFRITFTDGTSLFRRVTAAAEVSATVERLTVDVAWPADRTVAEVSRVEFLELTRLDADAIELVHAHIGRQTAVVPVVSLLDETE